MTVSSLQEGPAPGAADAGADTVLRLALTDFRCYGALRLEVDGRPVVLTGPNGAGKTNLLEALSMLAPGRGLRRAPFAELGRREAGAAPGIGRPWAVAASVAAPGGAVEIGTGTAGTTPAPQPDGDTDDAPVTRRQVRIDGRPAQPAALAGQVGMAWLTPEMDRMFNDSASSRRRFLDRLAGGLDRDHAPRLNAYERALRERARLLRDGRFGGPRPDPAWLAALEREMAEHGIAVAAVRADTVQRLNAACAKGVGPFPAARLVLLDGTETMLAAMPALDAEEALRARLADSRTRDAETGGAAVGPHRSDFDTIFIASGRSAADCSTGEQKALLIGIVLADARLRALEHGAAPVLLLDEIAAHLDEGRRAALFEEIAALGCQAWMTGTEAAMFAPLGARAQYFAVHAGLVTPA